MAPALDLMLNTADRVSRLLAAEDRDYYPIRSPDDAFELHAVGPEGSEPVD